MRFEPLNVPFRHGTLPVVVPNGGTVYVVYIIMYCAPAHAVGALVVRCGPGGVALRHDVIALPETGARLSRRQCGLGEVPARKRQIERQKERDSFLQMLVLHDDMFTLVI